MKRKKASGWIFIAAIFLLSTMVTPWSALAVHDTGVHAEGAISVSVPAEGGGLKEAIDAMGLRYESITSLSITAGTINLADSKFMNKNLKNLAVLELVGTADFANSTVPSSAFSGNTTLENVLLQNTAAVSQRAFYECTSLVKIELPEVTAIDSLAFVNAKALESVSAPKLVSMDNRAFYGASALASLTLGDEVPELLGAGNWFKDVSKLTVFVPTDEAVEKFKDAYEFSDFRIKRIGDAGDEDINAGNGENVYYDYKYDAELTTTYTGPYYRGDYKVSLNLYSFNQNLNAWLKGNANGAPPIDTMQAIRFAKDAGFDAVDVTAYYIPGYSNTAMPTKPREEIMQYAKEIRALATEIGIEISGTGVQNNFADPNDERRKLDVERIKYWIDVAAEMGAPVIRVFSGPVPKDIGKWGWEAIARDRIAPALKECAEYGAAKGVMIGLQNHGDMTATAGQTIQIMRWADHPNIGIVNDTGYFRNFRSSTGAGYDWYKDIKHVLPYSCSIQVKKKPEGQETETLIDLVRLMTEIRSSSYRGYIPVELLWKAGDPGYPKDLSEPPYEEIKAFHDKLRAALQSTKEDSSFGESDN